ncbi:MAG TPA: hypothetical protein VMZ53_23520 [Kofleriaceae bacterium]|nr:hypothetical protein [Kofleriaceae bacterium]
MKRALVLLLVAACGEVDEHRHLDAGADGSSADAAPDARTPVCWGAPFSTAPTAIAALNTNNRDAFLRLSPDELTAYFSSDVVGAATVLGLWKSTRASTSATFAAPARLLLTGDNAVEVWSPTVTANGLTLYFTRTNGNSQKDIYKATRGAITDANFSGVALVAELNTASSEEDVYVVPDGSAIYFSSDRGNGNTLSIFRAQLNGSTFSPPTEVLADTNLFVSRVVISPDELTMFYQDANEIHETRRASKTAPWTLEPALTVLGSPNADHPTWISPDGCRLYLESDRGSAPLDLYVAVRSPQ